MQNTSASTIIHVRISNLKQNVISLSSLDYQINMVNERVYKKKIYYGRVLLILKNNLLRVILNICTKCTSIGVRNKSILHVYQQISMTSYILSLSLYIFTDAPFKVITARTVQNVQTRPIVNRFIHILHF